MLGFELGKGEAVLQVTGDLDEGLAILGARHVERAILV